MMSIKTISVLGCGWYGLPLAKALLQQGFQVKGSTTSAQKLDVLADAGVIPYLLNISTEHQQYESDFFDCDVLWISIPPKSRQGEAGAYLQKIKSIIDIAKQHNVKQVVFISSTGVYGDVNAELTELDVPMPDTDSGCALLEVETYLQQQTAFTTTILRFGGLLGPNREPGRFFAGKKAIPNGEAPVNLIHLADCIGVSQAIVAQHAFGKVYNACAPHHPTKAHFYAKAATAIGLDTPEFIPELQQWKTVNSVHVKPVLGYTYQVNNWDKWLDSLF
ncbi:SDR family oxidoreductase [Mucilaginibacter lacusdianchii]|uniref:SDR family oxidoreductase n=1 Tax=Mucilaginibacter lacusdianchii TaxID=2684211 RepID=UPI00131D92B1|nr:SDR family oxidoreductase [Mucilaginibacter sp. JXJ CY 39]